MEQYIKQFKHNEDFYNSLCTDHADNYHDWKITCLFYCSYHLLQALASYRNVKIGTSHSEIFQNINPKFPKATLQIKRDLFEAYDQLFEYSRTARYDGFTDFDDFQIMKKADLVDALRRFNYLKKEMIRLGIKA